MRKWVGNMTLKNKNVLVIGLGVTGISAVKALDRLGAHISIYDSKTKEELRSFLDEIDNIKTNQYLDGDYPDLNKIDLILKSPGVPPNMDILVEAENKKIEIITDIELYYRLKSGKNILAITGTNGKTTTTKLTGEIFNKSGKKAYTVGNIGVGILDILSKSKEEDIIIVEASSYQLENTIDFKAKIALIINITPDHLDWHGGFENYINAKKKILINQDSEDYSILNYDDKILRTMGKDLKSNLIWFSVEEKLDQGAFIEDGFIVYRENGETKRIMSLDKIQIPGKHNLENILAAFCVAYTMGLDIDKIAKAIEEFKGVEHRIEYVDRKKGIFFYNDSKGTNPDSTIKAIEALKENIILIAGGYDKGSEYDELIHSFKGRVRELVLLGATKEKIRDTALKNNYRNLHLVDNMKEAVQLSYDLAKDGDKVLLSPACASWGMYPNFEERGKDFKKIVKDL